MLTHIVNIKPNTMEELTWTQFSIKNPFVEVHTKIIIHVRYEYSASMN